MKYNYFYLLVKEKIFSIYSYQYVEFQELNFDFCVYPIYKIIASTLKSSEEYPMRKIHLTQHANRTAANDVCLTNDASR